MVTRKPVPAPGTSATVIQSSPDALHSTEQPQRHGIEADWAMGNAWKDEDMLKSTSTTAFRAHLPDSLKVGSQKLPTNSSPETTRPLAPTNPFLRRHNTGSSNSETSADAWRGSDRSPGQTSASSPPPMPQNLPVAIQQFDSLTLSEPNTNPWQPALDDKSVKAQPVRMLQTEDSSSEAWSAPPGREAPTVPPVKTSQPVLLDLQDAESPAWDEDEPSPPMVREMPPNHEAAAQQMHNDRHAWDASEGHPLASPVLKTHETSGQPVEAWNMVDRASTSIEPQQSGVVREETGDFFSMEEEAPSLPPRRSLEDPPPQLPRPTTNTTRSASSIGRNQKKETYEIKKISWHDTNAASNPRVSPILVQNANGPCPLLALVNALTLSTPADVTTALVETLRSREQVSLGLLLDAVFDELMSGRRGDAAQELPDVSDLYSFLITLHTGMNVNPRFLPLPPSESRSDPRNSMSHVHPADRESNLPGTFEQTREMRLYSTFNVPLIHGWLAEGESPSLAALTRSAKSYEDAQNLMFREEELEHKLQESGLDFAEQGMLEDITTIKAFFESNPTQLTYHGLHCITTSLPPGAVAILFRNDHFSTLYRHPQTLQLLQLVTDMGYAGHEEVVWESLVDVNGENAEFFSGDFRLVGGATQTPSATSPPNNDGWTTVTGRRTQIQATEPASQDNNPPSSTTEQEDHDLALALQLQEEEEERHREEQARRRRETELSQQYIEQQGSPSQASNVPVTRRGGGTERGGLGRGSISRRGGGITDAGRPTIPPRRNNLPPQGVTTTDAEASADAPPPSYEIAATMDAYVPPTDHPAHPNAAPGRGQSYIGANGRGRGRGTTMEATPQSPTQAGAGRRNTAASGSGERERDCTIM